MMVVVVVDEFMKDFIHLGLVFQVESVLAFQCVRANRATNARLWAEFGIANEIVENANPGVMARHVVVVIGGDFLELVEWKEMGLSG